MYTVVRDAISPHVTYFETTTLEFMDFNWILLQMDCKSKTKLAVKCHVEKWKMLLFVLVELSHLPALKEDQTIEKSIRCKKQDHLGPIIYDL